MTTKREWIRGQVRDVLPFAEMGSVAAMATWVATHNDLTKGVVLGGAYVAAKALQYLLKPREEVHIPTERSLEECLGQRTHDMIGKAPFLQKSLELIREEYTRAGEDPTQLPDAEACAISCIVGAGLSGYDPQEFTKPFEYELNLIFTQNRENRLPPELRGSTKELIGLAYKGAAQKTQTRVPAKKEFGGDKIDIGYLDGVHVQNLVEDTKNPFLVSYGAAILARINPKSRYLETNILKDEDGHVILQTPTNMLFNAFDFAQRSPSSYENALCVEKAGLQSGVDVIKYGTIIEGEKTLAGWYVTQHERAEDEARVRGATPPRHKENKQRKR